MTDINYLQTPEAIAAIRQAVGSPSSINANVRSVQELKAKYATLGSVTNGTVQGLITSSTSPLLLTYSSTTNKWYSAWETIFHYMLATGRATGAAAAVGTNVNVSNEQFVYLNFQEYLDAGLTPQMRIFATGQSDTGTAFPIAKFNAVKYSALNPANVTAATPANVISTTLLTGIAVSSGWNAGDVTVTGTGSHLWAQGSFEVGGAAANITGYFMHVLLRWRT